MTEAIINAGDGSGSLYYLGGAGESYTTVHNATEGLATTFPTVNEIGQDYTTSTNKYNLRRGGLIFDTSGIGSGDTIDTAVLSLYGQAKDTDQDFDLTVVSGTNLDNPVVDTDYGDLLNSTTSFGSMLASTFQIGGAENQITLNSTGIAAIVKGGITKFGIRSSRDINSNAPTDAIFEYIQFRGTGSSPIPKLTINYTSGFTPKIFFF